MEDLLTKVQTLKSLMNNIFVAKEFEIDAVLASLISGEPALLVGDPGTAKTKMVETLASLVSARYFYYLLTKFTEPAELLGPLDIKALREGKYVRITKGRLPEAEVVFLDEVFKAGSAIRNILLDIILNKRIHNGEGYIRLPMLTLYTASNEISTDSEDQAFYDRLTIRVFTRNVDVQYTLELLRKGLILETRRISVKKQVMTSDEVRALQRMCNEVAYSVSDAVLKRYAEALTELNISDRRKVKVIKVAAAYAILYGSTTVTLDDVANALMVAAVNEADDMKKVEEIITKYRLSQVAEVIKVLESLSAEIENMTKRLRDAVKSGGAVFQQIRALKELLKEVRNVKERYKNVLRSPRVIKHYKKLQETIRRANEAIEEVRKELEEFV